VNVLVAQRARAPRGKGHQNRDQDAELSGLRLSDVLRASTAGLRARHLRTVLSALGVSIGIAAIVGVVGISRSSQAGLLSEIGRLGNLLTVTPGQSISGQAAQLPYDATAMVRRLGPVTSASATGVLDSTYVYRTDKIPSVSNGGISVQAADPGLLPALGAAMDSGRFLDAATQSYPTVVLGADAARTLGIATLTPLPQVWLGNQWFTVIGILRPVPLASEIDRAALSDYPAADRLLGFDGHATRLYVRTDPAQVRATHAVLAATANPAHPDQVQVSRPSDALNAQAAAQGAFNSLFLGLGAVALLVGGVGIANVMVISVLERRSEIGLRRALGATTQHIRVQFLAESLVLSTLGGLAGTAVGVAVTAAYASVQGWAIVVPGLALAGGLGAAVALGAAAGIYPAVRAARLTPTDALRA